MPLTLPSIQSATEDGDCFHEQSAHHFNLQHRRLPVSATVYTLRWASFDRTAPPIPVKNLSVVALGKSAGSRVVRRARRS